jgi:hypothetical protein
VYAIFLCVGPVSASDLCNPFDGVFLASDNHMTRADFEQAFFLRLRTRGRNRNASPGLLLPSSPVRTDPLRVATPFSTVILTL